MNAARKRTFRFARLTLPEKEGTGARTGNRPFQPLRVRALIHGDNMELVSVRVVIKPAPVMMGPSRGSAVFSLAL